MLSDGANMPVRMKLQWRELSVRDAAISCPLPRDTISHGAKTEMNSINRVDSRIFPASDCCLAMVPPLEKFCPSSAKFRR